MSAIETSEATGAGGCSPTKLGGSISIAPWTDLIAVARVAIALPKADHLILTYGASERLVSVLGVCHWLWITPWQLQTSGTGGTIQNLWRSSHILVVSLSLLLLTTTSAPSLFEIHQATAITTETKIAPQCYGSVIRSTQTSKISCHCSIQLMGLGTGPLKALAHLGQYWSHDLFLGLLTCRHLITFGFHLASQIRPIQAISHTVVTLHQRYAQPCR
mmetsp:Transcript_21493/g.61615  ORF Transcript_21493/g.61615 Transcript_21493/m.61615 type:complete len:217 (+) Transcript_21493:718-1368(+)